MPEAFVVELPELTRQDRREAKRFLTLLAEETESFTFQTFDDVLLPGGGKRKDPQLTRVLNGSLAEHQQALCELNDQGAGVFVTINETDGTGRKAKNIIRVRAIWQEQDRSGCPELPTAPHITVESSPGKHHRYILIDDCPLEAFRGIQDRMVEDFGSDPDARDVSRVLRLPGFFHMKNPDRPHQVRIVAESGERSLPYAEAVRLFPPVVRQPKALPPANTTLGPKRTAEIISAISALSPDLQYQEWLNVGMALHDTFSGGIDGLKVWDEWSSGGNSYRPDECTYKWSSFTAGGGVSIQTVFKMASETGWRWKSTELPEQVPTTGKKRSFSLIKLSEIVLRPPEWLIRDHLTTDSLAQYFADPASGKTFLAISAACSVATGEPFYGRQVKQRPVIFIAGEGHNGLKKRFDAWSIRHQVPLDDAPLYISSAPAAFLDTASVAEVLASVDSIVQKHGHPGLIVIDTVARNFGPGDENSTADMSVFIQAADQLREKYKAAIMLIHHSGHADKTRARGAMALKGALDFEYRLDRGSDDVIRVDCTKCKDFEQPAPMAFRLRSVELPLMDDDGQRVISAVLDATEYEPPPKPGKAGRGKNQTKAIEVLRNLFSHHQKNLERDGRDPEGARVTVDEWKDACQDEMGMDRKRFSEVKRTLEELGTINIESGFVRLIDLSELCPK